MPASIARQIAFDILLRVETQNAYASDLLHLALSPNHGEFREFRRRSGEVKRSDAALATELTFGVLRWQRLLDSLFQPHLKSLLSDLDSEVLIALRLALYQLRYLNKVPASAAVNESVELIKRARKRSAASLVNAVLRRIGPVAKHSIDKFIPAGLPVAERLGIEHSHPTWLVERWIKSMGEDNTIALLQSNNRPANLACVIHDAERRAEILDEFAARGLIAKPGKLLRSAMILSGGSPADTKAFRSCWISIQDEASQLIPQLLGVAQGDAVLDICAAPGGKTALLAKGAGPDGLVIAGDLHEHRLLAMRAHFARCGALDRVKMLAADASRPLPFQRKFNRILVDAPCSGTGTLARHPEIRWRLRPGELTEFHARQVAILRSALDVLAPNGRLVYSTCSLEPEENEQVVAEALAKFSSLQLTNSAQVVENTAPALAVGISAASLVTSEGFLRTFPPVHHTDGFFAALILKSAS